MKPSHRKKLAAVSYLGLFAVSFMNGWCYESPDNTPRLFLVLVYLPAHCATLGYALGCLPKPERARALLLGFFATLATCAVGYCGGIVQHIP